MAGSYQELFSFLERLEAPLEQLTEIQKEKTAAVLRDDLLAVSDCMKREQAISLSLRSMDRKRDTLLKDLGLGDLPLSALPEHCPPEHRARARELSERLRQRYDIYRSAAEVSCTTLEVNLHQIEKIIDGEMAAGGKEPGAMADIRA